MTTDWKALCAELLQELEHASAWDYQHALKDQARAALAQPEPVGPTDEELLSWASCYGIDYVDVDHPSELDAEKAPVRSDELRIFARTVLARWGRPTITPIPVSERLPGAEDCDAEGT